MASSERWRMVLDEVNHCGTKAAKARAHHTADKWLAIDLAGDLRAIHLGRYVNDLEAAEAIRDARAAVNRLRDLLNDRKRG